MGGKGRYLFYIFRFIVLCCHTILYSSISFRFRRKMSTFAGHVDRHRGVVVKSTIAATEQEKPTEFGPKLASNFLHFFFILSQGRCVASGPSPLVPKRGRGLPCIFIYIHYCRIMIIRPVQTVWRHVKLQTLRYRTATDDADRSRTGTSVTMNVRRRRRDGRYSCREIVVVEHSNVTCVSVKTVVYSCRAGRRRAWGMVVVSPATTNRFGWWHRVRVPVERHRWRRPRARHLSPVSLLIHTHRK